MYVCMHVYFPRELHPKETHLGSSHAHAPSRVKSPQTYTRKQYSDVHTQAYKITVYEGLHKQTNVTRNGHLPFYTSSRRILVDYTCEHLQACTNLSSSLSEMYTSRQKTDMRQCVDKTAKYQQFTRTWYACIPVFWLPGM
jgi:hypothetical protein